LLLTSWIRPAARCFQDSSCGFSAARRAVGFEGSGEDEDGSTSSGFATTIGADGVGALAVDGRAGGADSQAAKPTTATKTNG